jgi:hypothetical protein
MNSGVSKSLTRSAFGNFLADAVGIDIREEKYRSAGTSKANKLRTFWRVEPDYVVGKGVLALVEYVEEGLTDKTDGFSEKKGLIEPCKAIARRLMSGYSDTRRSKANCGRFRCQVSVRANRAYRAVG